MHDPFHCPCNWGEISRTGMRQAAGTGDCDSDSLVTWFVRANKASVLGKMGAGLIKILPIGLFIFISCVDSANVSAERSSLHRSICIHNTANIISLQYLTPGFHAEGCSICLGPKCHLSHYMPDTSEHKTSIAVGFFSQ